MELSLCILTCNVYASFHKEKGTLAIHPSFAATGCACKTLDNLECSTDLLLCIFWQKIYTFTLQSYDGFGTDDTH